MLLCLIVWAGLVLPTQAAYRCTAMEGSRISEPCCPSELAPPPAQTAISHHCCELIKQPTLDTPGTQPDPSKALRSVHSHPLWFACAVLPSPSPIVRSQTRSHRPGAPPRTPLPRTGTTVLQV